MKKLIKVLFIYILFLPLVAHADTDRLIVSCTPGTVSPGSTTTCSLSVTPAAKIANLAIPFTLSNGVTVTSFTADSKLLLMSVPATENRIDVSVQNPEDEFTAGVTAFIGSLVLSIPENYSGTSATITFNESEIGDGENDRIAPSVTGTITVTQPTTPTVTGIKSLTASTGVLTRPKEDENNYMLDLGSSATNFGLTAVANNSSDAITFTNGDTNQRITNSSNIAYQKPADQQAMRIFIDVGSVRYTVYVYTSASNELQSLTVGNVNVSLTSGVHNYIVTLADVSSYRVTATLKNTDSFIIQSPTLPTTMNGATEFKIKIAPKDSNSGLSGTEYTITVKKSSNGGGSSVTPDSSTPSNTPKTNPKTGSTAIIMAIILIISLVVSVYLYRKNLKKYD